MKKVVCVDDDPEILALLTDTFDNLNFKTVSLPTAEAVMELGEEIASFDLIVTDIKMPGMNGLELISALHKNGVTVPIIAISGIADLDSSTFPEGYDSSDISYRPNMFLKKPFNYGDIFTAVKKLNIL